MAQQYLVDIGMHDSLDDIIRKCNHNFRTMSSSQRRQTKNDVRNLSNDVADNISGLEDMISDEAETRQEADEELYELIQQSATTDYEHLDNKPSIESVTLVGDKTFPQLGIFIDSDDDMDGYPDSDMYALTIQDINALWNGGL